MSDAPILNVTGELVALGPLRRDLIPVYARWLNDFATLRSLGALPAPLTEEAETRWFEAAASGDGEARVFTIYERPTLRPIGTCDLRDIDHRNRVATMGMLIGEPEARGKGYGTEATQLLLDVAFTVLGLHCVWLTVYAFNEAGRRCYEKAGFREVGRRRESRLMGGRLWDEIVMDILAPEFASPVLGKIFQPDAPRPT
ncbi:MAG: GNAT family N-acetyltransferase [Thermomicrobiales bacterium]|nr:GNAT family N-acetyltransferase [Thermomicrobiales bacterium]